jgi:hypothetical protein
MMTKEESWLPTDEEIIDIYESCNVQILDAGLKWNKQIAKFTAKKIAEKILEIYESLGKNRITDVVIIEEMKALLRKIEES